MQRIGPFLVRLRCADNWVGIGGGTAAKLSGVEENDNNLFELWEQPYGHEAHVWFKSVANQRFLRVADNHLYELVATIDSDAAFNRDDTRFRMKIIPYDVDGPFGHYSTYIRRDYDPSHDTYWWAETGTGNYIRANRINDAHPNASFEIYVRTGPGSSPVIGHTEFLTSEKLESVHDELQRILKPLAQGNEGSVTVAVSQPNLTTIHFDVKVRHRHVLHHGWHPLYDLTMRASGDLDLLAPSSVANIKVCVDLPPGMGRACITLGELVVILAAL